MTAARSLAAILPSDSFLEYAFLRWVLGPATRSAIATRIRPQGVVKVDGHSYHVDYEIVGDNPTVAIELDGFAVHGTRSAFTYDRLRQNDLTATGRAVVVFSYDAIRSDTARCVTQLQAALARDTSLAALLVTNPHVETPEMHPDPMTALAPSPRAQALTPVTGYFENVRAAIDVRTLRECQSKRSPR